MMSMKLMCLRVRAWRSCLLQVYQRMAVEAHDALQHSAEAMRKRSQEAAKRKQEEELRVRGGDACGLEGLGGCS